MSINWSLRGYQLGYQLFEPVPDIVSAQFHYRATLRTERSTIPTSSNGLAISYKGAAAGKERRG